jgi:hypothetical protein
MMDWEGCGRMQSQSNLGYCPGIFLEGSEEGHENPQSGLPVSQPGFELGMSQIQVKNDTAWASSLGET